MDARPARGVRQSLERPRRGRARPGRWSSAPASRWPRCSAATAEPRSSSPAARPRRTTRAAGRLRPGSPRPTTSSRPASSIPRWRRRSSVLERGAGAVTRVAVGRGRAASTSTTIDAAIAAGDGAGLRHLGQQRDRRDPADRRRSPSSARERGVLAPRRRDPGVGKLAVDLRRGARRPRSRSSAHKLGGPKGVGAWSCARPRRFRPSCSAAARSGGGAGAPRTWPASSGFGVACELARARAARRRPSATAPARSTVAGHRRRRSPRRALERRSERTLPNTLNVEFAGRGRRGAGAGARSRGRRGLGRCGLSLGLDRAVEGAARDGALARAGARELLRFSVGHGVDEAQIDRVLAVAAASWCARARRAGEA